MPWQSTFTANFDNFDRALEAAKGNVQLFETRVKGSQAAVQRLVSEFDGTKVIQQAKLMAAAIERLPDGLKLTAAEQARVNSTVEAALAKYRAMGQQVPANLQRIADATRQVQQPTTLLSGALGQVKTLAAGFLAGFTVQAAVRQVTQFVTSTIAAGGALTDLSAKTGVSTTALQKWDFAAKQNGNSLDQITRAVSLMGDRLASGDKSAVAAVGRLGLNFEEIRRQQPEQAFNAIAAAIAKVPDPMQQTAIAMDVFGRAGAEILPTLKADMSALGAEAQRLGLVMSEETIRAMDDLGDTMDKVSLAGQGLLARAFAPMVPAITAIANAALQGADGLAQLLANMARLEREGGSFREGFGAGLVRGLLPGLANVADFENLSLAFERLERPTAQGAKGAAAFADQFKKLRVELLSADDATVAMKDTIAAQTKVMREAEQEAKRLQQATDAWLGRDTLRKAAELLDLYRRFGAPQTKEGIRSLNTTVAQAVDILVAAEGPTSAMAQALSGMALATLDTSIQLDRLATSLPTLTRTTAELERVDIATREYLQTVRDFSQLPDILQTPTIESTFRADLPGKTNAFAERLAGELGQAVVASFAGGGDLGKTVGAVLGQAIGKKIGQEIGRAIGGTVGKTIGAFAGPVVGAAAGELFGAVFSKITKAEGKQINDLRDQFILAAGGLGALNEQAVLAGVSLNALLRADSVQEYNMAITRLQVAFKQLEQDVAATVTQLGRVNDEGRLLSGALLRDLTKFAGREDVREALGSFLEGQTTRAAGGLQTFLDNSLISSSRSAAALENSLLAVFGSLTQQGASPLAAIQQLTPAIEQFAARAQEVVGFEASGAFQSLLNIVALTKDEIAGPAITAVGGLGDVLVGLNNTGFLTEEIFDGLTSQITDTFQGLQDIGKGGPDALRAMQQPLQRVWELSEDFGFTVDANTQELLNMGLEAGLIGERFRPAADRMANAIDALIQRFDTLITTLETNSIRAADGIERAFNGIDVRPVVIPYTFERKGDIPEGVTPKSFATGSGGIRDFGAGTLAVLHGREAVVTEAQLAALSASSSQMNILVFLDGDPVAAKVLRGSQRTVQLYGG